MARAKPGQYEIFKLRKKKSIARNAAAQAAGRAVIDRDDQKRLTPSLAPRYTRWWQGLRFYVRWQPAVGTVKRPFPVREVKFCVSSSPQHPIWPGEQAAFKTSLHAEIFSHVRRT